MANPTKIAWSAPTQNTDGSPFDASQYNGFTIYIDGKPGVSVPAAWATDGAYAMLLSAIPDLISYGAHSVQLTVSHKNGNESDKSNAAIYTIVDSRKPKAPFGAAVS